jgi:hypothetical protein
MYVFIIIIKDMKSIIFLLIKINYFIMHAHELKQDSNDFG